jgi:hypothetical protein
MFKIFFDDTNMELLLQGGNPKTIKSYTVSSYVGVQNVSLDGF